MFSGGMRNINYFLNLLSQIFQLFFKILHMLINKSFSDQQMNEKSISSNQLSQQQLRQRRRERILARAPNNNSNQYDRYSSSAQQKQNSEQKEKLKDSAISALEIFNASKRHSKIKFRLQMIAIIMGIMAAGIHHISSMGQIIFVICFLLIAMFSAYLEVTKANQVSKFSRETAFEDPLIEKISAIKQLNVVNKMLNIQASISPIAKLMSSYFLLVVILGCVLTKQ